MIGVGAPWILGATIFAALATCVLHFLSVRRPPVLLLPTMRFLPERPVRAVSRSARPSDLLLLLLRVAALLLAGVALSGLFWRGSGVKHGRVVVLQRVGYGDELNSRDAVKRALSGAFASDTITRIVVMDSIAHVLTAAESRDFRADTLSRVASPLARVTPTLSGALLAAMRAAGELVREQRNVDAVDLVIVAPFTREWKDAAVPIVRASWPGAIRFSESRVVVDSTDSYKRNVVLVGEKASDAVQSAFAARGWLSTSNAPASTSTAMPIPVEWPASGAPQGWETSAPTVVGAVVARGEALVFPFARSARVPKTILAQGRAIAWWSDGEVAAIEIPTAKSCTRHVGIPVPSASDVMQGQAARALLMALTAPCGGEFDAWPIPADELRALAGTGPAAPATSFKSVKMVHTPGAPFLLLLAVVLLVVEWLLRDREEQLDDVTGGNADVLRKVA